MFRVLAALAAAGLVVSFAFVFVRVERLAEAEVDASSPWRTLRELGAAQAPGAGRLIEARLVRGAEVRFELCTADAMEPPHWMGALSLRVVRLDRSETVFEQPIDRSVLDAARHGEGVSCVEFARVSRLALDEPQMRTAIDLAWDHVPEAVLDAPVRARIVAVAHLSGRDRALVAVMLGAAMALVVAFGFRSARPGTDDGRRGAARVLAGVSAVVVAGGTVGTLGRGSGGTLASGMALAAVEIAIAFALVHPAVGADRCSALGLARPARPISAIGWMLSAPFVALALFAAAALALRWVPSTAEAPIEVMVRSPSGMLSFAALAVVAPIAEEVFFRGLVYATLRGRGGWFRELWAISGSWMFFALAHLPQDWGNWGGLVAVLVAGLGFTLLRSLAGSTLVSCLAHLVYNGLLVLGELLPGEVG